MKGSTSLKLYAFGSIAHDISLQCIVYNVYMRGTGGTTILYILCDDTDAIKCVYREHLKTVVRYMLFNVISHLFNNDFRTVIE